MILLSGIAAFLGRGEEALTQDFRISISRSDDDLVLTWSVPDVVLQTSQTLNGDWVDLPESTSPHRIAGNLDKSFFRLRKVSTIRGVEPAILPTTGGTLYVRGVNFDANSTVTLNGLPAGPVTYVDPTLLLVNVPTLTAGHYDLAVSNGAYGAAGFSLPKGLTVESAPLASLEVPPGMAEGLTATGEINLTHVDLQIDCPVGPDFVIARTHRSRHGSVGSPFGTAWDFSCNISVQMDGADVVVNDGWGRSDKFFRQPNGTFQRAEFFREGSMNGQVFTLTLADRTIWTFRALDAAVAPGKITAITDRNGNAMTYSYGVSGRLEQVTDALGRTCQFTYNGSGQVIKVTDFAGRTVTYAYYGASEPGGSQGDLKSMTSPAVTGTPNGNDFPLGKTVTYTYTKGFADERLNHNLTGVIDNTGVQVQTITYTTELNPAHFDFDRVVSTALAANPPAVFSFEPLTPLPANRFAKTKVTMNDPVGNVSETLYDSKNRPVSIKELTGRAIPGIPVTAAGNQPTNKLRASDPAFFETTLAYNLDSQVTQITYPRGNTVTMTYASDLSRAIPVRERGNLRQVTQTPAPGVPSDQDQITEKFEYLPGFGTSELPLSHGTGPSNTQAAHGRANFGDISMSRSPRRAKYGQCMIFSAVTASFMSSRPVCDFDSAHEKMPFDQICEEFFIKRTDPRGGVWTNQFDANGNLTSSQAPGLATGDSFEYNAAGQLTAHVHPADANGRRKRDTFSYYSNGTQKGYLQSAVEDAGAGGLALTTTYAYDAVGNVTSVTDPRGNDTQFVFNQLDQLMQVKSAPGGGGVRQQVDFVYSDTFSTKSNAIRSAVALMANGGDEDRMNDLRRINFNINPNVEPFVSIEMMIIRKDVSHFDENGNPIGDGRIITGYGYDSIGRLTSVTDEVSAVASTVTQFEYDANGQVTKVLSPLAVSGVAPFNTVQTQYDERGLLFQEISAPGSPDRSTTQNDYDANGNLSRVSEGLEGTPQVTTVVADGFAGSGVAALPIKARWRCMSYDRASISEIADLAIPGGGDPGPTTTIDANGFVHSGVSRKITVQINSAITPPPFLAIQGWEKLHMRWTDWIDGGSPVMGKDLGNIDKWNRPLETGRYPIWSSPLLSVQNGSTGSLSAHHSARLPFATYYQIWRAADALSILKGSGSNLNVGELMYIDPDTSLRCKPAKITDPLGNVTEFHYDASGNLTRAEHRGEVNDDPGSTGNVKMAESTFTYDAMGRLDRGHTTYSWNTQDATPQEASECRMSWSGQQLVSITNANGQDTAFTYDTVGRLSRVSDPKGNSTAYAYDANDNVATVTHSLKSDLGNPDLVFTRSFTYDKLNRCTSAKDNVGNTESFAYDSRGNVVRSTDARGIVSQFAYDGLNRLTRSGRDMNNNGSTLDPVDIVTSQSWDANSRLATEIDPNGNLTSYGYDALNRLTQTTAADGTAHSATYDVHGNVISSTDANGTVTSCNYDLNNRLLQKNIVPAAGVASTTTQETFAYDGLGRVTQANNNASTTSFTYDSLGRILTETQNGLTVTSTYDAAGNRLTVAYPGGRTIGYAYDAANLPATVSLLASNDGETPGVLSTNRYIGGQPERVDNRNNTRTSYSYNGVVGTANPLGDSGWGQIGRVQTVNVTSGAVIDDTTYRYDAAQNQTGKTTIFPGKTTAKAYQYDASDRLVNTAVTTNGAQTANITYTLDKAGNRLNVTGDNHPGAYTLNNTLPEPADFQMNQYTTTPVGSFSYDKNGNRIAEASGATTLRTFSYDYANRLVAINSGSTGTPIAVYGYDALGRRILKSTQSGATLNTTRYVYDGDKVIEERDGGGTVTASFTHGNPCGHYTQLVWDTSLKTVRPDNDNIPQFVKLSFDDWLLIRREGTNYWPATDVDGSTMALTLDNGTVAERYDYADYGEPAFFDGSGSAISGSAVGNTYLWGGMRYDSESGFYGPGSFDPRVATYAPRRVEVQKGDCVGWAQTRSMDTWRKTNHAVVSVGWAEENG